MLDKEQCDHDKSYSSDVILTYPTKHKWICRKCLAEGIDTDSLLPSDYGALKRLKEADDFFIKAQAELDLKSRSSQNQITVTGRNGSSGKEALQVRSPSCRVSARRRLRWLLMTLTNIEKRWKRGLTS